MTLGIKRMNSSSNMRHRLQERKVWPMCGPSVSEKPLSCDQGYRWGWVVWGSQAFWLECVAGAQGSTPQVCFVSLHHLFKSAYFMVGVQRVRARQLRISVMLSLTFSVVLQIPLQAHTHPTGTSEIPKPRCARLPGALTWD